MVPMFICWKIPEKTVSSVILSAGNPMAAKDFMHPSKSRSQRTPPKSNRKFFIIVWSSFFTQPLYSPHSLSYPQHYRRGSQEPQPGRQGKRFGTEHFSSILDNGNLPHKNDSHDSQQGFD